MIGPDAPTTRSLDDWREHRRQIEGMDGAAGDAYREEADRFIAFLEDTMNATGAEPTNEAMIAFVKDDGEKAAESRSQGQLV